MPNYVKNRLIVPNDRADEVLAFVKGDKTLIDFNKIAPMPECLDCADSSIGDEGMEYLLLKADLHTSGEKKEKIKKSLEERGYFDEAIKLGNIYINNIASTGYKTWYKWGIDNWGTKWNAMEPSIKKQETETYIEFDTAWSGVIALMEKLSARFPDVPFVYKYADEDTGSNCGYGVITNGSATMHFPEQQSRDAYDLAFELRPNYAENYELKDGNYVYKEEE